MEEAFGPREERKGDSTVLTMPTGTKLLCISPADGDLKHRRHPEGLECHGIVELHPLVSRIPPMVSDQECSLDA